MTIKKTIAEGIKEIKCAPPCNASINISGKKSGDVVECPHCTYSYKLKIVGVAYKLSESTEMDIRRK